MPQSPSRLPEGVHNVTMTVRSPGRPERGITLDTADEYDVVQDVFSPANHGSFRLALARPTGRRLTPQYVAAMRAITWPDTVIEFSIDDAPGGTVILEDQLINLDESAQAFIDCSGRDAAGLLIDNVCNPKLGSTVGSNATLPEIMDKLLESYRGRGLSLDVIVGNGGNRAVMTGGKKVIKPRTNTIRTAAGVVTVADNSRSDEFFHMPIEEAKPHAGEHEWQFISRHAQNVGCLVWVTAEGNFTLATPGYDQPALYRLQRRITNPSGNNILSGGARRTTQGAATSMRVLGHVQGRGEMREQIDVTETLDPAAYLTALKADGTNAQALQVVTWPRRRVMHDSHAEDSARARRVARRGLAKACAGLVALDYTVAGHAQSGRVYAVDTICEVDDEYAGVRGLFWVTRVQHTGRRGRRTTALRMIPKGALVL